MTDRTTFAGIIDQHGEPFAIVLYPPDTEPAAVPLTPSRALAPAESLIAAARRRITEIHPGEPT